MKILSIDIGHDHLGLVGGIVWENYKLDRIFLCKLINIKSLVTECDIPNCPLKHSLSISDYMSHLFMIYQSDFEEANCILVERQPPTGFIAIQELVLFKYREKTHLISPNSVHKHFGMSKNQKFRKIFTTKFSHKDLHSFEDYQLNPRKHDLGDAYCILIYYLSNKQIKYNNDLDILEKNKNFKSIILKLESLKFNKKDF